MGFLLNDRGRPACQRWRRWRNGQIRSGSRPQRSGRFRSGRDPNVWTGCVSQVRRCWRKSPIPLAVIASSAPGAHSVLTGRIKRLRLALVCMGLTGSLARYWLVSGGWQGEAKRCSARGIVFHPQVPVMGLDNRSSNRQSKPHPALFSGEECLKQMR